MSTTTQNSTGRRKTSVARVSLKQGTGEFSINGKTLEEAYPTLALQNVLLQPLVAVESAKKYDITAYTKGGGVTGQLGAIQLGIARALVEENPNFRAVLKAGGFLRRDPRMKERKKPGQPGARKRFQFSKR